MKNKTKHYKMSASEWLFAVLKYIFLILWAMTTFVPLLWVLINAFKSSGEILRNSLALPTSLDFENFITIINYPDVDIPRSFVNSFIISGSVVVLVVVIASLAAFALGRMRVKASKYIMAVLTACLLVPSFATVIPNFVTISHLPMVRGTHLAAILPQTAGNLCFSIIMMTGFMQALPQELDEAAVIDGASVPQIFFIWSYNDLFTSLVYISERTKQPVCVILSMVSNMFGTDYGAMMAAIVVTILPLLVLYMFAQDQVVNGLTAGAVKG